MAPRRQVPVAQLVQGLRRPLLLAARDGFAGLRELPTLGAGLRGAVDRLLEATAQLPPERVGPLKAWRKVLERFEKLTVDEQEIEIARGMRLCLAVGSVVGGLEPLPPAPEPKPKPTPRTAKPTPDSDPDPDPALVRSTSPLDAATTTLPGIGPTLAQRLAEKGLETVEDLAWFVPRRYDDLRDVRPLHEVLPADPEAPTPERTTLVGEVFRSRFTRFRRRYLEVVLRGEGDEGRGEQVTARWFNVHGGMAKAFVPGARVAVSGRLRRRGDAWEMANPDVLGNPSDETAASKAAIRPRYSEIEGVAGAIVRKACRQAVDRAAPLIVDGVPAEVATRLGLPSLAESLVRLHGPPPELTALEVDGLDRGESEWHRRLAFDELFFLALAVARRRLERRGEPAMPCLPSPAARKAVEAALPFPLTGAQRRAIAEIEQDLGESEPMNRLLQGDVGSGKTAVAFAAAHLVLAAGRQVAIMAPTEILAEQHARTLEPWAKRLGHRLALLTASTPKGVRESTLGMLQANAVGILVGTHALLAERVTFADLGLAVVDEQHRFGVAQRVRLRRKNEGAGGAAPHLLVMTATPIPRTLALTFYGDLDVTTLDELPPGRTPPETKVFAGKPARAKAYRELAKALEAGQRAFVVCPLVEKSEDTFEEGGRVWADVESTCDRLAEELAPARVGKVHGQMPSHERDAQMTALREGRLDVLVATTVIEVGVDVPQATVMLIEDADRFGLAQLHQLRGRVGRGGGRSQCLLLTQGARTSDGARRLDVMAETSDGFRIAEEDLALRGFGELLGARQSGLPKLRFGDLSRHASLLEDARREAQRVLDADPTLAAPAHAAAAQVLEGRLATARAYGAEGG